MTEHARLARSLQVPQAVVVQNGQMLRLAPGPAQIVDETPSGRIHLDGKVLVEEGKGHARARNALAQAGFIAVTIPLDQKGRVAGEPSLIIEGIPDAVHEPIRDALDESMRRHNPKRGDEEALRESTRRAVRRAASDAWGKKPVTRVEIIWV
jgi:ribonuclease J